MAGRLCVSNLLDNHHDSASVAKTDSSSWEHGWYVFENGQVVGPLNVQDALGKNPAIDGISARLVSRKGFTQWYPVRDFAEIYAMIGSYSEQLNTAKAQVAKANNNFEPQSKIIAVAADAATNENNFQDLSDPETIPGNNILEAETRVQAAQTEISGLDKRDGSLRSGLTEVSTGPVVDEAALRSPTMKRVDVAETAHSVSDSALVNDPRTRKEISRQVQATQAAARAQKLMDPTLFTQHYFAIRGRLRLGRVFSPVIGALIYTPLTLGGYWWDWFARSSEEVSWHVNGSSKVNLVLPVWTCMIPGVHLVLAYLLANKVSKMEMENGYRSVSPKVATLMALFPPFYILMIQSALNRHWRLHVYHSATPS